jgi:hypothetical protein
VFQTDGNAGGRESDAGILMFLRVRIDIRVFPTIISSRLINPASIPHSLIHRVNQKPGPFYGLKSNDWQWVNTFLEEVNQWIS